MPTQDKHPSHIRSAGQINSLVINSRKPNNYRIHHPITLQIQKLINTLTQKLANPKAPKPINSLAQNLKLLSFILQYRSNFRLVLAKIQAKK